MLLDASPTHTKAPPGHRLPVNEQADAAWCACLAVPSLSLQWSGSHLQLPRPPSTPFIRAAPLRCRRCCAHRATAIPCRHVPKPPLPPLVHLLLPPSRTLTCCCRLHRFFCCCRGRCCRRRCPFLAFVAACAAAIAARYRRGCRPPPPPWLPSPPTQWPWRPWPAPTAALPRTVVPPLDVAPSHVLCRGLRLCRQLLSSLRAHSPPRGYPYALTTAAAFPFPSSPHVANAAAVPAAAAARATAASATPLAVAAALPAGGLPLAAGTQLGTQPCPCGTVRQCSASDDRGGPWERLQHIYFAHAADHTSPFLIRESKSASRPR